MKILPLTVSVNRIKKTFTWGVLIGVYYLCVAQLHKGLPNLFPVTLQWALLNQGPKIVFLFKFCVWDWLFSVDTERFYVVLLLLQFNIFYFFPPIISYLSVVWSCTTLHWIWFVTHTFADLRLNFGIIREDLKQSYWWLDPTLLFIRGVFSLLWNI